MNTLTTASTKVAGHVTTNSRPVAPAFLSRYSAERYRQAILDAHVQRAWLAPDPVADTAQVMEHLASLDAWARRARNRTLLGMAALLVLAGLIRYFL